MYSGIYHLISFYHGLPPPSIWIANCPLLPEAPALHIVVAVNPCIILKLIGTVHRLLIEQLNP